MKTILYLITQSEFGGAQKYILDLSLGLKEEFNIYIGLGEQGENGEFAQRLMENNIEYYILKHLKREISPINDFFVIFEIIKLIKKTKPDIIHLNSSKISILGSIAATLIRIFVIRGIRIPPLYKGGVGGFIRIIYTVHGWVFNEPLAAWKKSFYFWAEKLTALLKNRIICISRLDYNIAKNQLKIKEEKLSLIYHGIKQINFLSREEAREKLFLISKLQFPISNFLIGTIANFYKTKGLEYLIESIRIIKDELRVTSYELRVIIIGEGEERKNLEDLISQLNLKSHVFLVGNIKNAAEFLPAFDIYVSSSVKEGFPYSILEAMSAGLPIVATKVGGVPEMISDGENGLLAEPANPEELAKRIKILVEDKNLRKILGEQAKKNIDEKFRIEKMIEKIKEVYLK